MAKKRYYWSSVFDCVLQEQNEAGQTQVTYTHEPSLYGPLVSEDRGGQERQYHFDALGSTRSLTDNDQAVTDTFAYDAWGNEVSRTGVNATPYTWVGRIGYRSDHNTATAVRRRDYSPSFGRWRCRDAIEQLFAYGPSFEYATNRPTAVTDASGLIPDQLAFLVPTFSYSVLAFQQAPITPVVFRGGWTLSLYMVRLLTDNVPSYVFEWRSGIPAALLPPPPDHQVQHWLLTSYLTLGVNSDCQVILTPRQYVVDVNQLLIDPTPPALAVGCIDYSIYSADGEWCQILEMGTKIGGINGADWESRLPPIANWENPPQSVIDMILRESRAKYWFAFSYEYINPAVCNRCTLQCAVGSITECLTGFWGTICNQDFSR